jgi:hypothetical protein
MMLRNWKFWLIIAALIGFLAVWIMEGLTWAIATLVIVGGVFAWVLGSTKRRRSHDIYIIEDEERPKSIYVIKDEQRPIKRQPRRSAIQTGLDWHVPKINKDGAEFITGAKSMRKNQENAMRRTKKRLWG